MKNWIIKNFSHALLTEQNTQNEVNGIVYYVIVVCLYIIVHIFLALHKMSTLLKFGL